MKVELTIDNSQLGDTVVEIFNSLTPEQKTEIAYSIVEAWLKEPHQVERSVQEAHVFKQLRSKTGYNGQLEHANKTDDQLRNSYEFSSAMRNYKSSRDVMVESLTREAVNVYAEKSKELVSKDPQLNAKYEEVRDGMMAAFPHMVQQAMTEWFAGKMESISEGINKLSYQMFQRDQEIQKYLPQYSLPPDNS